MTALQLVHNSRTRGLLVRSILGLLGTGALVGYGTTSSSATALVILILVYGLLALGSYVPLVLTDQVSLAYGVYAGIGAYTLGIISIRGGMDPVFAIPLGAVLAASVAALLALSVRRLSGYFLAVSTLLAAVAFDRMVIQAVPVTGGSAGLFFMPDLLGWRPTQEQLMLVAAVVVVLVTVSIDALRGSTVGRALLLLSSAGPAAQSVGIHAERSRVVASALGAAIASLAGAVAALSSGFLLPETFSVAIAFLVLFMPLIGGVGTAWGCVVGGALVAYLFYALPGFESGLVLFGIAVVVILRFFPSGILGIFGAAARYAVTLLRKGSEHDGAPAAPAARSQLSVPPGRGPAPGAGAPLLGVENLSKRYGGVRAVDDVSFVLRPGEVLGVVGPNGAGKSTLINLVTGHAVPDSGRVLLNGRPAPAGTAARAQAGLARTFQHPQVAGELTIAENVELGRLRGVAPLSWAGVAAWFLTGGRSHRRAGESTGAQLALRQMPAHVADTPADEVSYAVEKATEIARAVQDDPPVLLLDEPFAGLDRAAVDDACAAISHWLTPERGIVVVDHNVDLMRAICHRFLVLAEGTVIAEGEPEKTLADERVRAAYFGTTEEKR